MSYEFCKFSLLFVPQKKSLNNIPMYALFLNHFIVN